MEPEPKYEILMPLEMIKLVLLSVLLATTMCLEMRRK
jgi:hypothetical protein